MNNVHAVVLLIVGAIVLVMSLTVLYLLSGLWRVWLMNGSIIDMILSVSSFSATSIIIAWPLIGYWLDAVSTSFRSEDK